jgi:diamine N-acetyltransferase
MLMCKLKTSTISLVNTTEVDIDLVMTMEKENAQFILPYSRERHIEVLESEDEEHFLILNNEGDIVGFIILAGLTNPHLSLEFRRIVVSKKRLGYGSQVLHLIKDYCFFQLRFHRLWLDVFEENYAAIRLYETVGFKREGMLRECVKTQSGFKSLVLMSILFPLTD